MLTLSQARAVAAALTVNSNHCSAAAVEVCSISWFVLLYIVNHELSARCSTPYSGHASSWRLSEGKIDFVQEERIDGSRGEPTVIRHWRL